MIDGMKTLGAIVFLLTPVLGYSQEIRLTGAQLDVPGHNQLLFVSIADCEKEGIRLAENDMAKGAYFLLLQSGLGPVVYASDKIFEQKFGVQYFEEGCSAPSKECMMAYNARIFRYLQRNYAKTWWESIRKDTVGFKEWKKSIKP
ncbi:FEKKY domain-containing protein [Hymenobacter siberiensis]|uniref:FEKKY domain-containing protein n=1 Tax=Hymenobacter siberiensis TaxID=2848396 RepID=UPI001C1E8846|nr:hypothetical protein [Hymenobacter siberiensis]MBU6120840.1 hypothetical protein [Hymenobacter siberiensis]